MIFPKFEQFTPDEQGLIREIEQDGWTLSLKQEGFMTEGFAWKTLREPRKFRLMTPYFKADIDEMDAARLQVLFRILQHTKKPNINAYNPGELPHYTVVISPHS